MPSTNGGPTRTPATSRYRHEAFLWHGIDDYLSTIVPFVREALAAGEGVLVAVAPERVEPLREALGPAAAEVRLVDLGDVGANPARIIPMWVEFAEAQAAAGRAARGIGEPLWSTRRPSELTECRLHEALLDTALPAEADLWLLCPYDAEGLPEEVLDEARRSHRVVDGAVSPTHTGHAAELFAAALPPAPGHATAVAFGPDGLAEVRGRTESRADDAGLPPERVEDLALAVHEVAANTVEHGGGRGDLLLWEEPDALVVEVRDAGRIDDLLAGRRRPAWDDDRGRGLWLANQLCDLVQLRSGAEGTTVRLHTWR